MLTSLLCIILALAIQIPNSIAFAPIVKFSQNPIHHLYSTADDNESSINDDFGEVAFVLLAGGTGSRMKANMPKQFLELRGMPILHHSLDLFLNRLPAYAEEKGLRYG